MTIKNGWETGWILQFFVFITLKDFSILCVLLSYKVTSNLKWDLSIKSKAHFKLCQYFTYSYFFCYFFTISVQLLLWHLLLSERSNHREETEQQTVFVESDYKIHLQTHPVSKQRAWRKAKCQISTLDTCCWKWSKENNTGPGNKQLWFGPPVAQVLLA